MSRTSGESRELHTALVARARELAPLFEAEGPKSEALRRPTDVAIDAMVESGLLPLLVPKSNGGHGLDLDAYVDVGLELGRGDASLTWVALLYIHHNWMYCQLPESFQKEIFADTAHVPSPACPSFTASARRQSGGYRLNGRWSWATCIMHSSWVMPGALCEDDEEMRFFAVPIDQVEIHDIWHMTGMSGTGSNDFTLEDVFVPDERTMSMADLYDAKAPGATIHADTPVMQTPMMVLLMLGATVVLTAQAKVSVERLRERMRERVLMYQTGGKQADNPAAQIRLGRLQLEVEQTEIFLHTSITNII